MKIRNNTRIMALVLALVMLLPLISIPTFAEEQAASGMTLIASEDFEGYEADQLLAADDNLAVVPKNIYAKAEGDNVYLDMDCAEYNDDTATSFNNSTMQLKHAALDYETNPVVILEGDYYYSDAGLYYITQFTNVYCEYTLADGTVKTDHKINWFSLTDSSNNKPVADKWSNVKVAIDMKEANIYVIIDGVVSTETKCSAKVKNASNVDETVDIRNLRIGANTWLFGKVGTSGTVAKVGRLGIDNLAIYSANDVSAVLKPGLAIWGQSFDKATSLSTSLVNKVSASQKTSLATASLNAEEHRNVLKREFTPYDNGKVYLYNKSKFTEITTAANADGTYTGTATVGDVEYSFVNSTLNKTYTEWKTLTKAKDKDGNDLAVALVNGAIYDVINGAGHHASFTYLKSPSLNPKAWGFDTVTVSANLYFSTDANFGGLTLRYLTTTLEGGKSGNLNLAKINAKGGVLTVAKHADSGETNLKNGSTTWVGSTGGWIKLDAVVNLDTGNIALYVNNDFLFSVDDRKCASGAFSLNGDGLGIEPSRGTTTADAGYVELDDVKVIFGDVAEDINYTAPAKPAGVIYQADFDGYFNTCKLLNGAAASKSPFFDPACEGMSFYKMDDGNVALRVDSKENDNNSNVANPKIDKSEHPSIVYEMDAYIPSDTLGRSQVQIGAGGVFSKDGTTKENTYNGLWQIAATETDTFIAKGEGGDSGYKLQRDTWFKISTVVDLEKCYFETFVDGDYVCGGTFTNYTSLDYLTANSFKFAKVNKNTKLAQGAFYFDNPIIFDGDRPSNLVTSWSEDFSDWTAEGSYSAPESAVLVDNGYTGKGVQITIGSSKEGNADYRFAIYSQRVLNLETDEGPAPALFDEAEGIYYAFANDYSHSIQFKFIEGDDKNIEFVGYHGFSSGTYADDERTDVAKLKEAGYTWGKGDSDTLPIRTSLAELEMGGVSTGNKTIDIMFKPTAPEFRKNFFDAYVLEAKYFISEDAKGGLESQLYDGSFRKLYGINATAGTVNGAKIEKGQWFTVTTVIADTQTESYGDVYLNGYYIGTTSSKLLANGLSKSEWSVIKVMKGTDINNFAGTVTVDDASITTVAPTMTVPGILDYEAFENGLLESVDGASIRLKDPTGLRFASKVDTDKIALLDLLVADKKIASYNMGTLITPASYVEAAGEFSKEALEKLDATTPYLDVEYDGVYFSGDANFDASNGSYLVGSIVKILDKNIDRTFAGGAYVEIHLNDGTIVSIYADAQERSVRQVADLALADENANWDEDQLDVLNKYATPKA